jgi:hypothetical protein
MDIQNYLKEIETQSKTHTTRHEQKNNLDTTFGISSILSIDILTRA